MTTTIVRFLNIIVAALLAGVSLGIWIGFNPLRLSPAGYLEQQQNMLRALLVLMISLVVLAIVITLVSAYLQRQDKRVFYALLLAAGFFLACMVITRFGNKPIDDTVLGWTAASLPANWTEYRDEWWSWHKMRTMTEIVALFIITWVSIKKN